MLYSQEFDAPESSDTIHTTHYPDGAVVQYDHAAHALTANLPGGTAAITADNVTSDAPSTICTGNLSVMKNLIVMKTATARGATTLNGGVNAKPVPLAAWPLPCKGQSRPARPRWHGRQLGQAYTQLRRPVARGPASRCASGHPQPLPQPLSGIANIRQSISNILTTPIGSRLMRRRCGH